MEADCWPEFVGLMEAKAAPSMREVPAVRKISSVLKVSRGTKKSSSSIGRCGR
jgi:hypothetical protein